VRGIDPWKSVGGSPFGRWDQWFATEMGSREWERITTMAEVSRRARRGDLSLAVFAAADQPGFHRDYLRKRCQELTGRPPPRPRLAIVR